MSNITPRFAIPYLAVSQAHKEITHNEALSAIDFLMHASVEGIASSPPSLLPVDAGKSWVVASPATGAWLAEENAIAGWTGSGWRFIRPDAGTTVWNKQSGLELRFIGGEWLAPGPVSAPSGGVVVDSEARNAISALLIQLRSIGLLGT